MKTARRISYLCRPRRLEAGALMVALALAWFAPNARADEPTAPTAPTAPAAPWRERYEAASKHLLAGEHRVAETEFLSLATNAPSEAERRLALEMARIASRWASDLDSSWVPLAPKAPPSPPVRKRTRDEITLLYTTSFLYGVGTGAWFLLQTQPDAALSATLPFVGITAAPVLTLAIVDGYAPLPHGMPHAISAGMYVGLGEGFLVTSYQHARARRTGERRFGPEDVSTVLWTGATLGGLAGAVMAVAVPTTPGRASFTASSAIWGGVVVGFAAGAAIPETPHRTEDALLAAAVGYNGGAFAGVLSSAAVAPSTSRVRLIDLSGVGGGLIFGGGYLALAHGGESRVGMGMASLGSAGGLVVGWLLTRSMQPDLSSGPAPVVTVNPTLTPVPGGAALGITGSM